MDDGSGRMDRWVTEEVRLIECFYYCTSPGTVLFSHYMKAVSVISLFALTVSLCSCPYSSSHGIDETPNIYVEDALIGSWSAQVKVPDSDKSETIKMALSRKTDTEYNIVFTGYLDQLRPFRIVSSDSLAGSAFMSTVDGRQFLNIKIQSRTYIAELQLENEKLSLLPLAESFTNKMIFTSEALRNSVSFHYKSRVHPVYDGDFCLRGMVRSN
jgi:hypothetical protein